MFTSSGKFGIHPNFPLFSHPQNTPYERICDSGGTGWDGCEDLPDYAVTGPAGQDLSEVLASDDAMRSETYKRLRMVAGLSNVNLPQRPLPTGFRWQSWRPLLVSRHAQVKWHAFRDDLDGRVFSCLSRAEGCLSLVREIASQRSFCPQATWLVVYQPEHNWPPADVGTIQGIIRSGGRGAIQNVGVVPGHRSLGLGRALVVQAMLGFQQCGMNEVSLEVTAQNIPAVRLYQSLGFRIDQTLYRVAETGEPMTEAEYAQLDDSRKTSDLP